ncbi:carboxypeptidase-like regulatory domain-containing protein [Natronobeatus ordinarius]|uniref:carboxypeptidase-like regulatory domain-containing protein n=1 Tax=Natronobeatus ordinarius TaxID=2963433 RepID=UPI0020CB901F|nr:carboxypeptidase-like regulatory domain-containing protein [Natronobeatus ordinarius]
MFSSESGTDVDDETAIGTADCAAKQQETVVPRRRLLQYSAGSAVGLLLTGMTGGQATATTAYDYELEVTVLDPNTADLSAGDGDSTLEDGVSASTSVSGSPDGAVLDVSGSITVLIQSPAGDEIPDSTVELYHAEDWTGNPDTSIPLSVENTGEDSNISTFDGLAVGDSADPDSHVDYVIRAVNEDRGFVPSTSQVSLHDPDQTGPTEVLTLEHDEFVDEAVLHNGTTTEVRIEGHVLSQDGEDSWPAAGQTVELTLSNDQVGNLYGTEVVLDADGIVSTIFEAGPEEGVTDIDAVTWNAENETFETDSSQNATVFVYDTGQITGDVITDESELIPGADVTLFRGDTATNDFDEVVDNTITGPEGSYSFVGVVTGDDYQIEAEYEGETGVSEPIPDLEAQTVNRDIVIAGAELPSVEEYASPKSGRVETDGLRDAIDDWRDGDVDTDLLRDVIDYWRSGDQVN